MQLERPRTRVEEKQGHLANMVRMIAQSQYHALFIVSAGGAGKSRVVTNVLREEGQEMILFNSHCTALQLYRLLYLNRENDAVLFFDDCDSLYRSAPALGILRSSLFGQPDRICTYNSSSLPDDLPPRFSTVSRFVFCANQVPKKDPMFDAVLTRCLVSRMDLSTSEILEQFRVMSADGYPGCSPESCEDIIDFIEEHSDGKQLSMRLLTPAVKIFRFCTENNTDWRPVVLAQMQNLSRPASATKRLNNHQQQEQILSEAQTRFPDSVAEQQKWFCEKSRKSRATFYRVLNRSRNGS